MKFSKASKNKEITVIIQLLTIFGTIEQRQLRILFDYMSENDYGKILTVLKREGIAYFSPDGRYISTNRYSLDHGKKLESVLTFWAFIHMRDRVLDFCSSEPPSILSFSSGDKDFDLVPGNPQNTDAINAQAETISAKTVRFIVVKDLDDAENLVPRPNNDYFVLVGAEGVKQMYKL